MLKDGMCAKIEKASVPVLPIFDVIKLVGALDERDMFNTFNMGIGMVIAVAKEDADKAVEILTAAGEKATVIGEIAEGEKGITIS